MLKVVFDTNIVVSALLVEEGLPAALLDLATSQKIQLFYSPDLMAEYERVLDRPKLSLPKEKVERALDVIKHTSIEVIPKETLRVITEDPADNRILEVSQAAKADYIITGNKKHFPFSKFRKTRIVNPREFIEREGTNIRESYPYPVLSLLALNLRGAYALPEAGTVRLSVYNVAGQRIRTLADGYRSAGTHSVVWDGKNDSGRAVASGVYVYRLVVGGANMQSRRMVLLRETGSTPDTPSPEHKKSANQNPLPCGRQGKRD